MIQLRTMLKVADNSGAKIIQVINVYGGTGRRYGRLGDVILGTVKKAEPRKLVKKHEKVKKDGRNFFAQSAACYPFIFLLSTSSPHHRSILNYPSEKYLTIRFCK